MGGSDYGYNLPYRDPSLSQKSSVIFPAPRASHLLERLSVTLVFPAFSFYDAAPMP
jgi:hypothetical protein